MTRTCKMVSEEARGFACGTSFGVAFGNTTQKIKRADQYDVAFMSVRGCHVFVAVCKVAGCCVVPNEEHANKQVGFFFFHSETSGLFLCSCFDAKRTMRLENITILVHSFFLLLEPIYIYI